MLALRASAPGRRGPRVGQQPPLMPATLTLIDEESVAAIPITAPPKRARNIVFTEVVDATRRIGRDARRLAGGEFMSKL
jgi:hypothetical protein